MKALSSVAKISLYSCWSRSVCCCDVSWKPAVYCQNRKKQERGSSVGQRAAIHARRRKTGVGGNARADHSA